MKWPWKKDLRPTGQLPDAPPDPPTWLGVPVLSDPSLYRTYIVSKPPDEADKLRIVASRARYLLELLELPDEEWDEFDNLALTGRIALLKEALSALEGSDER